MCVSTTWKFLVFLRFLTSLILIFNSSGIPFILVALMVLWTVVSWWTRWHTAPTLKATVDRDDRLATVMNNIGLQPWALRLLERPHNVAAEDDDHQIHTFVLYFCIHIHIHAYNYIYLENILILLPTYACLSHMYCCVRDTCFARDYNNALFFFPPTGARRYCCSATAATTIGMADDVKSDSQRSGESLEHMLFFFNLSIRKLAFVGVSLPLITLLTCLATAYVFQYDDVHETHCQVSRWRRVRCVYRYIVSYRHFRMCSVCHMYTVFYLSYVYCFLYVICILFFIVHRLRQLFLYFCILSACRIPSFHVFTNSFLTKKFYKYRLYVHDYKLYYIIYTTPVNMFKKIIITSLRDILIAVYQK